MLPTHYFFHGDEYICSLFSDIMTVKMIGGKERQGAGPMTDQAVRMVRAMMFSFVIVYISVVLPTR